MLFEHLHPQQFESLNNLASHYPEQAIRVLEPSPLASTHDIVGKYLIKAWNLPDEIAIAVAELHFPDYGGKHAPSAKLAATTNRPLQNKDTVDACHYTETPELLE